MCDINWSKLGKGSNAAEAWDASAIAISKDLFNNKMAVVHNLADAADYDLMVCFCKEMKVGVMSRKEYKLLDHISDLVKTTGPPPGTDLNELLKTCSKTIKEDIQPSYSNTWTKGKKSVSVVVEGMSKHVVNWALYSHSLVLDTTNPVIHGLKTIYIICEVVYAEGIEVELSVEGQAVKRISLKNRTPFAFYYEKFPVDNRGLLGPALTHKIDPEAEFAPANKRK